LLVEWNDTRVERRLPDCAHKLFEQQVARTPDRAAISYEGETISYWQLNSRANQLAHYLCEKGVGPEVVVGLYLERSPQMVVALLAVLKAGGGYLPLDVNYPERRLAYLLENGNAGLILTLESMMASIPATDIPTVYLDRECAGIARRPSNDPPAMAHPDNLAYVIYTSGSTGAPKGVAIAHRGVCNLALAQIDLFGITAQSTVLQFAPMAFDASVSEWTTALLSGARLLLAPRERLMPGPELIQALNAEAVDTVTLVPSVLAALPEVDLPHLKTLVLAGEYCPAGLAARWYKNRVVLNAYGPTEATVCATVSEPIDCVAPPPIGRPISNVQVYILDDALQPVPIGVTGELHIAGCGIARCYLNMPALTAENFIPNPFDRSPGSHMYSTGDMARWTGAGEIEFVGRYDQQVKIRGNRIELGEIESVLAEHPLVRQAAVVTVGEGFIDKRLVAYVSVRPDWQNSAEADGSRGEHVYEQKLPEIQRYLAARLPEYMTPAPIIFLPELPLTPSGKIDRSALPSPDTAAPNSASTFVAPRTMVEEKVAEIWAELLGLEQVGVHDHFFDLGGHSLLATRVISRVREVFQVELPLRLIFANALTVAGMADTIELYTIEQASEEDVAAALKELDELPEEEIRKLLAD